MKNNAGQAGWNLEETGISFNVFGLEMTADSEGYFAV